MEVGEVRPAEDSDFDRLIELASKDPPEVTWELAIKKTVCSVYTNTNDASSFKMIRVGVLNFRLHSPIDCFQGYGRL